MTATDTRELVEALAETQRALRLAGERLEAVEGRFRDHLRESHGDCTCRYCRASLAVLDAVPVEAQPATARAR